MTTLLKRKDAAQIIADQLSFSYRHVYDRYFYLPDFPKPVKIPSVTGKRETIRWKREDILKWVNSKMGGGKS